MVHVLHHVVVNMQYNQVITLAVKHVHITINKEYFIVLNLVLHHMDIITLLMEEHNVLLHVVMFNINLYKKITV